MSKFNRPGAVAAAAGHRLAAATSPITTTDLTTLTHEGAPAHTRDARSDLFLLAVSNMVSEDTFYESAGDRDNRYRQLITAVALTHGPWLARFLPWLRQTANMRSAPLVGALEAVRARLAANVEDGVSNRQLVDAVLQRPDEPGEAIAYWTSRYGRAIPKPVKRGIADAATRLYTQRSLLKYDTDSKAVRFADVLELCHPKPAPDGPRYLGQGALFKHAIDRRHGRPDDEGLLAGQHTLLANRTLRARAADHPEMLLDTQLLGNAGMTWEDALSLAGPRVDKAKLWSALAPTMGYMALLRNLRNFDEAGMPDNVAAGVAARLADPEQVAKSRQLPFRFLSAYEHAPSLRWAHALDTALGHALGNIPKLPGRTLILIDTSLSMTQKTISARSTMTVAKAAAVFGVALAAKGEQVDMYGFADGVFRHDVPQGAAVIREVDRFVQRTGEVGHGTQIVASLNRTFSGHDRVFIISDMQTMGGQYSAPIAWARQGGLHVPVPQSIDQVVPARVPVYGFNLGGHAPAIMATGANNRHEFGGLTDTTFKMVPLLEAGANWPF